MISTLIQSEVESPKKSTKYGNAMERFRFSTVLKPLYIAKIGGHKRWGSATIVKVSHIISPQMSSGLYDLIFIVIFIEPIKRSVEAGEEALKLIGCVSADS